MQPYIIVLIVVFNMLAGCKNSKSQVAASTKENNSDLELARIDPAIHNQSNIPPQYCRISAHVLQVIDDNNQLKHCKKEPCYAMIKIKQVLGYGSSFPATFQSGDEVLVFFPISLNVTDQMPGLGQGDSFKADMEGAISLSNISNQPSYTIYSYELE